VFYKKLKSIQTVARKNTPLNYEILSVLLLFAYPDRLAKKRAKSDGKYILSNAKGATLQMEDSLFTQEFLVVANLYAHERDSLINLALSITMADLEEYFSSFILTQESILYNKEVKNFEIRENSTFFSFSLMMSHMSKHPIGRFIHLPTVPLEDSVFPPQSSSHNRNLGNVTRWNRRGEGNALGQPSSQNQTLFVLTFLQRQIQMVACQLLVFFYFLFFLFFFFFPLSVSLFLSTL